MECFISADKTGLSASSQELLKRLARVHPKFCNPSSTFKTLGMDFASGKVRASFQRKSVLKVRLRNAKGRTKRLCKLRAVARQRARKVFTAGIKPAVTFGAAVYGLSNDELKQ
eukprot:2398667-Lingulodinium_polyedra.AAC.1